MTPHKILKTFPGSQTGNDHDLFHAGTVRHLSPSLAAVVVREGWAQPHAEDSPEGAPESIEEKALDEAPANKAVKAAPANKSKK